MANILIDKMKPEDVGEVVKVDEASFTTSWNKEIFLKELKQNKFAHYFVVKHEEKVIGYAGIWVVEEDCQVTNIAISPEYRGKNIGELLFNYIYQYAIQLGVKQLSLEVRTSNIVAQNLYRKFGLVPGGIRKEYYTDNLEDAIVMWVKL